MAKEEQKVTMAIAPSDWQIDYLDTSVEGVPVLDHEGVEVPASKEDAVKEAAKRSGVSVRKVS